MKKKDKSCSTCSFYIEDIDILNLSSEEQVEFENLNFDSLSDEDEIDIKKFAKLFSGIYNHTCIGGLIEANNVKMNCKYHCVLPPDLDRNELIQLFINKSNKLSTKKSFIINTILGIATLLLSVFGIYISYENASLKKEIDDLNTKTIDLKKLHLEKVEILNDSVIKLNTIIKNYPQNE